MNTLNETHGIGAHAGARNSAAPALPPVRTRRPARMGWVPRGVSVLLALCMLWSFVAAPAAAAARAKGPQPARPRSLPLSPARAARLRAQALRVAAMQRRARSHAFPYRQANAARRPLPRRAAPAAALTILSDVGQLAHVVPASEAAAWRRELTAGRPAPARAARLHLWLGEYRLARDQEPGAAFAHFQAAQRLTRPADPVYGAAAYDRAMAFYSEGAYADAATAFRHLLTLRPRLSGFDPRSAALWLRHAGACAGYHADRARAGVPEPPRLDPLCGAAALAASLRALGRPAGKRDVLACMRVTGEGSSVGDVVNAARALGVNARTVRADAQGLRMLPKPLVAYVEHDHFVSVVRADQKGVSYLCSDCGPWPGGRVDLTWRQWRLLEGGLYVAVTRAGSAPDRQLAALAPAAAAPRLSLDPPALGLPALAPLRLAPVRLAAALSPGLDLGGLSLRALSLRPLSPLSSVPPVGAVLSAQLPSLRGHVVLEQAVTQPGCGFRNNSNQCQPMVCCKTAGAGPGGVDGPGTGPPNSVGAWGAASGDPVNVATGEEEYRPAPDLEVYNPHGPGVSWGRLYNSLRRNGQGYFENEGVYNGAFDYEMNDFGQDWSTPYNVGVSDPYPNLCGEKSYPKSVFFDNGAHVPFYLPNIPKSGSPPVQCLVSRGVPFLIYANYGANGTTYTVVFSDRTQWVTAPGSSIIDGGADGTAAALSSVYPLGRIVDRNGHALTFHYDYAAAANFEGQSFQWPLLSSITNDDGTALLRVARVGDGSGAIAAVSDCYGRSVLYHVSQYANSSGGTGVPGLPGGEIAAGELDHVSQVVATGATAAPDRYVYGYQGGGKTYLHTITVPNPITTGPANSIATIDYADDLTVKDIRDGNGNTTSFAGVAVTGSTGGGSGDPGSPSAPGGSLQVSSQDANGSNYTQVTVSGQGTGYSYVSGYDMNMSAATQTDGNLNVTMSKTFDATSPDPYRPTSQTDGNGNTAQMTWDQYGNMTGKTPLAGPGAARTPAATAYTYAYPTDGNGNPISTGELQQEQQGTKTATQYAYYEPSGLVRSINSPLPGTAGAALPATPTYAYQYDTYGDITSVTARGNNAASTITTTYGYTSDPGWTAPNGVSYPGYSQGAAFNQALTVTDGNGNTTHYRYDAQDNKAGEVDAQGYETDKCYYDPNDPTTYAVDGQGNRGSLDNQLRVVLYPATGQTGPGRAADVSAFLYPGGPILTDAKYDEASASGLGNMVRQVALTYGPEGEMLSQTGDGQSESVTYDADYRPMTFSDGKSQATAYAYYASGYLASETYPNGDRVQFTKYDTKGNLQVKIDPRGVETDFLYTDPQSLLTDIKYPATPALNVHYALDPYGRKTAATEGAGDPQGIGSYAYAYDDLGRQTAVTTTYTGLPARMVSYGYYPDGSFQSMAVTDTTGNPGTVPGVPGATTYQYDPAGRAVGLTNPFGEQSAWSYLSNNWLQSQDSGGVVTAAYAHNARGVVTDCTNTTGAGTVSEFGDIQYDSVGDMTQVTASVPSAPGYGGTTYYGYDAKNEVTGEQGPATDDALSQFNYDGAGNPTKFRGQAVSPANSANQLPGLTYDRAGNPTGYNGNTLAFDAEDRLTGIAGVLTCGYRGDGLRAWKQSGADRTYFLYSGTLLVCEMNTAGAATAVNTVGAAGLISRHTSSGANAGSVFYTFDAHGSVCLRLDGGGGVLSSQAFDAYGYRRSTDGNADPCCGFGGQSGYYTDWETGTAASALELLGLRYYDPQAGRFLTRDPASYGGGANLYEYCNNQPEGMTQMALRRNFPEDQSLGGVLLLVW